MQQPPDSGEDGYLDKAVETIQRSDALPDGDRSRVAAHLAACSIQSPRAATPAAPWLGRASSASATGAPATTGPDSAPADAAPTLDFADLPAFDVGSGPMLYSQDLATPSAAWPATTAAGYTTRYSDAGYELELTSTGEFEPVTAPRTPSVSDQLVTATAATIAGQGGWGVWCRGTDQAGSRGYEFLISHTGAVQIIEPGDTGTGWVHLRGLDLSQPVTLTAHCADVIGAPIELTLVVNGRVALTYRPSMTLGPGYAGIEGMTFADVEGPKITAAYRRFTIARGI